MNNFIKGKDIIETAIDYPLDDGEPAICISELENKYFIQKERLYDILEQLKTKSDIININELKKELERN